MPPTYTGFQVALAQLKGVPGTRFAREGWNGKGMYIAAQFPDENSKMQRPYLYIVPGEGFTVPWVASQADLMADDWYMVSAPLDQVSSS